MVGMAPSYGGRDRIPAVAPASYEATTVPFMPAA
jgi:hypothetical protein